MSVYSEIYEQTETLNRTLASQLAKVQALAGEIKRRDPAYLFLAARGTSDNAARYANYLFGSRNGLALALATPSLFTYYHTPPRLDKAVVIGISQSGQGPDVLSVLEEGKKQGCLTAVLTNDTTSPMANIADHVLALDVGVEHGVAATKTYTAELMLLAMLSAALDGNEQDLADLKSVQRWVNESIKIDGQIKEIAQIYAAMEKCVVLGRGYHYASAFEWALKMKEMAYVEAEPYSSADFLHGPVAIVEGGFPILAVAAIGGVATSMVETLRYLKNDLKARLAVISNDPRILELADDSIAIPEEMPEWLTPIAAIIPAQLFAYHLTKARGFDPENPRTIHKVTRTE